MGIFVVGNDPVPLHSAMDEDEIIHKPWETEYERTWLVYKTASSSYSPC